MRLSWSGATLAALAVMATMAATIDAQARIKCSDEFQVVRGQGHISTPYCQDEYLARVARGYGIRVSGSAIRRSVSRKEEVCRAIGHDGRVSNICQPYRPESCTTVKC